MTARGRQGGFTLIELLLAAAIFAMLSAALFSVFHGALQLREKGTEAFAQDRPQQYAATLLKRDLQNMLPPAGILAGAMVGENNEETDYSLDTLEFYATSGVVTEDLPWGEIIHLSYALEEPAESQVEDAGFDLVRLAERNLLASTEDEEDVIDAEERLLEGVASLDISYFDGEEWQESWDSTTQDNALPGAVKVRIDFVDPAEGERVRRPLEVLCEITCSAIATDDASATEGGSP